MAAILDAILDFSARTNFRQCIPLVSQTTDYKVHFGICHALLYFYEHPTFILALKVTLLSAQRRLTSDVLPVYASQQVNFSLRLWQYLQLGEGCLLPVKFYKSLCFIFLTYETEFVLILAVLENSVLPMG